MYKKILLGLGLGLMSLEAKLDTIYLLGIHFGGGVMKSCQRFLFEAKKFQKRPEINELKEQDKRDKLNKEFVDKFNEELNKNLSHNGEFAAFGYLGGGLGYYMRLQAADGDIYVLLGQKTSMNINTSIELGCDVKKGTPRTKYFEIPALINIGVQINKYIILFGLGVDTCSIFTLGQNGPIIMKIGVEMIWQFSDYLGVGVYYCYSHMCHPNKGVELFDYNHPYRYSISGCGHQIHIAFYVYGAHELAASNPMDYMSNPLK